MLFIFFIKPGFISLFTENPFLWKPSVYRVLDKIHCPQLHWQTKSLLTLWKEGAIRWTIYTGICSWVLTLRICMLYNCIMPTQFFLILAVSFRIWFVAVRCQSVLWNTASSASCWTEGPTLPWQLWRCPGKLLFQCPCPAFLLVFQWYVPLVLVAPAALAPLQCWNDSQQL